MVGLVRRMVVTVGMIVMVEIVGMVVWVEIVVMVRMGSDGLNELRRWNNCDSPFNCDGRNCCDNQNGCEHQKVDGWNGCDGWSSSWDSWDPQARRA